MEIKVRVTEGVIILDLSGTIDVNSASLVEAVGQCLRDGYRDILCNFDGIEGIDYIGISALVLAYKEVANYKGRMRFVSIPAQLRNLFSISGLDRVVEIYATEDSAVNSFKEDEVIENIKKLQLRRRFKRLPVDIKIELKQKHDTEARCVKVDIVNLSAVGAFIFGCEKFKLGDEVVIKFKLASDGEELVLDAIVVSLADKQVQPHLFPGIGVEFKNITPSVQEKIFEFVERNASLLPTDE
jgi:stage II sporulation protein AA (anti-sigma F factor antagonist)